MAEKKVDQERIVYIQWLQSCNDLSTKSRKQVLKVFPDPGELFRSSSNVRAQFLTPGQANILDKHIQASKGVEAMRDLYSRMENEGIRFAVLGQREYPEKLAEIPDAPLGIYYKGNLPDNHVMTVAVIGSRDCSEYGAYVAAKLGRFLGEHGVPVISGMARGIDGIAQKAALEAGGESFGVLGCGVDVCYPKSNREIYDALITCGGILSEYPPGASPIGRNFPARNRIVSGLSLAVIVVEAAYRSGTGITVSMALEQGRDVYAVPGRVTDRLSDGCNRLIRQGAAVFTDPESFLEELQETHLLQCVHPVNQKKSNELNQKKEMEANLPESLQDIWKLLDYTPIRVEELADKLGNTKEGMLQTVEMQTAIQTCATGLMELVICGYAKQVSPGYFCRV